MLGEDLQTKDITSQQLSLLGADGGGVTEVAEVTDCHRLSTTDFKLRNIPWKLNQVMMSKPQLLVRMRSTPPTINLSDMSDKLTAASRVQSRSYMNICLLTLGDHKNDSVTTKTTSKSYKRN